MMRIRAGSDRVVRSHSLADFSMGWSFLNICAVPSRLMFQNPGKLEPMKGRWGGLEIERQEILVSTSRGATLNRGVQISTRHIGLLLHASDEGV